LRTLCLGWREISPAEYADWHERYEEARATVTDDRQMRVDKLVCEIETRPGLRLLGATGIEDRLQDGVPETIQHLCSAGIAIWMLTGDKLETALNIGKACRLLTDNMENIILDGGPTEVLDALNSRARYPFGGQQTLTITGAALGFVLDDQDLSCRFLKFARSCRSVICCRASPKQKARVVELMKHSRTDNSCESNLALTSETEGTQQVVALAIGDGANDVAMITVADVGVGLSGKEGAQASRAADFACAQFRFLERLLLVHGRESYRRNAVVVCYNFYKNFFLVLPLFIFGFYSNFTGVKFYEEITFQMYNMAFTCVPIIFFALFDRPKYGLDMLQLDAVSYRPGLKQEYFNKRVFALWMVAAFVQALLLILLYAQIQHGSASRSPSASGISAMGVEVYALVILGANVTLMTRLTEPFPLTMFSIGVSLILYLPILFVAASLSDGAYGGMLSLISGEEALRFWVVAFLFVGAFLLAGEPLLACTEVSRGTSQEGAVSGRLREPRCQETFIGAADRSDAGSMELGNSLPYSSLQTPLGREA